ncbi:unnamed protein product [Phaedon cochleariae]|uniref:F-box domain-containing protein n=1 Tax=Phaedon cochleariae TaxID=80249 RepID=A0A9P0DT73_PHACE|nr:unnamed protein product [Phaedon cochleariae]
MIENQDNLEEINEEPDQESDCVGYYTRSKRRKLNHDVEKCTTSFREHTDRRRKNPIMFLPTEMLRAIFENIDYHELSQNVRLVNTRFRLIAEDLLNKAYKKIEQQLETLVKTTEVSLSCNIDDMEIRCLLKLLNFLEILKMQYDLVISTIWRYVYNEYYRTSRSCMYGGQLIDAHRLFIFKFLYYPNTLYGPAVVKEYALPPEVIKIIQMTKSFCVHFDKINEEPLGDSLVASGCKIVDIVKCSKFSQELLSTENSSKDYFRAEYSFYFRNTWFVALPIHGTREMDLSQKQRMMHMRLRRIILAHNDMYTQQAQYERELLLRRDPDVRIKRPGNNVYTGYGDVGNVFFYYGVMNDSAYNQKFNSDEDNDEDEEDEENIDIENEPVANIPVQNSDEDIFYRLPHLGLRMNITVRCPLSYAPLPYLKSLGEDQREKLKNRNRTTGPIEMKITFECEGATYPRLPNFYQYDVKPKQL